MLPIYYSRTNEEEEITCLSLPPPLPCLISLELSEQLRLGVLNYFSVHVLSGEIKLIR